MESAIERAEREAREALELTERAKQAALYPKLDSPDRTPIQLSQQPVAVAQPVTTAAPPVSSQPVFVHTYDFCKGKFPPLATDERQYMTAGLVVVGLLLLFSVAVCAPELKKNLTFLPATCQPYMHGSLYPHIRPYRACYSSCHGCWHAVSSTPCAFKMGMHSTINEYNMEASWYIAGPCAGPSCCQAEQCRTCTRRESRCSRRRLFSAADATTAADVTTDFTFSDEGDAAAARPSDTASSNWTSALEGQVLSVVADDAALDGGTLDGGAAARNSSRRLQSSGTRSCHTVTVSFRCNCYCAVRVPAQACNVHCEARWRSFIPVRVAVSEPTDGSFVLDSHEGVAALAAFDSMLADGDGTPSRGARASPEDAEQAVESTAYSTFSALSPAQRESAVLWEHKGYSRVVTLEYEHGASRHEALAKLTQPQFCAITGIASYPRPRFGPPHTVGFAHLRTLQAVCSGLRGAPKPDPGLADPGVVSQCWYDPHWPKSSPVIKGDSLFSGSLAYAHEMGYSIWKWLLLVLSGGLFWFLATFLINAPNPTPILL